MKYLIITYDEYINIPFISEYEKILIQSGHEYDVILWNRRSKIIEKKSNWFLFESESGKSKISKVIPFLRWRNYVRRILRKGNYDRLIVLTTIPAVLIADTLLNKYNGRYWLDIRDYTYEGFGFYRKIVSKLVLSSAVTSISSPSFTDFLPECNHLVKAHNMLNIDKVVSECTLGDKSSYVVGFVGGVRYFNQNKKLISSLANSPKFKLEYVGKWHTGCDLKTFCDENGISNVQFFPAYQNERKFEIYESIDLINSIYGDYSEVERLALPNRLYDAAIYKKPIIVSKGTFLSDIVTEYDLGIAVDLDKDSIEDMLLAYISTFDKARFEDGCGRLLQKAQADMDAYRTAIEGFCR